MEAIDDALLGNVGRAAPSSPPVSRRLPASSRCAGEGCCSAALDRGAGPIVDACREHGLLVLSAGPDVLRFLPPLVVTEAEVDEALGIARGCARDE